MATLAGIWLSTHGHSLYEHLTGEPQPIPLPRARTRLADYRAETLLCGLLYYYPDLARQGAASVGMEAWHIRGRKARAMWEGSPDPAYRLYVLTEYNGAADEVLDRWARLRLQGADASLYEATPDQVAAALAGHIVRLAHARDKLREAEELLKGREIAIQRSRSQVTL